MKKQPVQKISKKQLVKNWLLSGRSITHRQCSKMFGADRLSDIIFRLRKEGMLIESPLQPGKDRFLNDVRFSKYRWQGEVPRIGFSHISKSDKKTKVYSFQHRYPMDLRRVKRHVKDYVSKKLKASVKKMTVIRYEKEGKYSNCSLLLQSSRGKKIFLINKTGS